MTRELVLVVEVVINSSGNCSIEQACAAMIINQGSCKVEQEAWVVELQQ